MLGGNVPAMSSDSSDKTTADQVERRGQIVSFPSNGSSGSGYFAPSLNGSGPGVLVIQEWWGLVPHIMNVVDRYADAGFSALAPDLYRGEKTTEPDEAGKLMMALNLPQAVKDMSGAIDYLVGSDAVSSSGVGVTGFCMGGGLALVIAATAPEHIQACAPYYGLIPWPDAAPDWSRLSAPVHGHYAEKDGFFTPDLAAAFRDELVGLGKDAEITVHPGVEHAFFNDDRPEVYDAATADECWRETTEFFRSAVR
jgi:carboxymethylenebutenolidase